MWANVLHPAGWAIAFTHPVLVEHQGAPMPYFLSVGKFTGHRKHLCVYPQTTGTAMLSCLQGVHKGALGVRVMENGGELKAFFSWANAVSVTLFQAIICLSRACKRGCYCAYASDKMLTKIAQTKESLQAPHCLWVLPVRDSLHLVLVQEEQRGTSWTRTSPKYQEVATASHTSTPTPTPLEWAKTHSVCVLWTQ